MRIVLQFFRPTLVRRVAISIVVGFFLSWGVLWVFLYSSASDLEVRDTRLRDYGNLIMTSIGQSADKVQVRAIASAHSDMSNDNYHFWKVPGFGLIQVSDHHGSSLYLSPQAKGVTLLGDEKKIVEAVIQGMFCRIYRKSNADWIFDIAECSSGPMWLIKFIGLDIAKNLLIALPFVLLPLWLAVSRGLRPLQQLSRHIASKHPDDLSPLAIDPKYEELKPLATAMDKLLGELRGKIEREHAFVQDAAHELRTPLAVISAQAHALAKADNAVEREEAERSMDLAIARASHLIAQLLQLAKMDSSQHLDVKTVDLAQLLRQELANMVPTAMERHIELSLDAPESLMLTIDLHAFLSVVNNLIGNALRYVQADGRVEVSLRQERDQLVFSVADNGPGISLENRAMVFERFYREQAQTQSGSGLGLAIVKQAAARLRGALSLTDGIDDQGCCFTLAMPCVSTSGQIV